MKYLLHKCQWRLFWFIDNSIKFEEKFGVELSSIKWYFFCRNVISRWSKIPFVFHENSVLAFIKTKTKSFWNKKTSFEFKSASKYFRSYHVTGAFSDKFWFLWVVAESSSSRWILFSIERVFFRINFAALVSAIVRTCLFIYGYISIINTILKALFTPFWRFGNINWKVNAMVNWRLIFFIIAFVCVLLLYRD